MSPSHTLSGQIAMLIAAVSSADRKPAHRPPSSLGFAIKRMAEREMRIMETLRDAGPCDRNRLASAAGASPSTASVILNQMLEDGMVRRTQSGLTYLWELMT